MRRSIPRIRKLIVKRYYHIGLAVDTPEGLVVPVLRDADQKGVFDLAKEIESLSQKAQQGKLAMNDLQGASFTISSLGAIGGTGFTPIINAPEVAILGVSRLTMRPHWNGKDFEPRRMLPLSLSYDHRAINGAEAGRFVTTFVSDARGHAPCSAVAARPIQVRDRCCHRSSGEPMLSARAITNNASLSRLRKTPSDAS
jgi:pyruvate/2-oxoglutarate dehydrogenase complex dihydrolipoamide acyltransferase (E2) component